MGKFEKSFLNSITSLLSVFISSLFLIILGRIIIENLGSDYNGVNATATQILNILTLIEGGFTTASVVSLFDPYMSKNISKINDILTTTSKTFLKIGIMTFLVGTILSVSYSFFIKSSLPQYVIILIFLLSISSTVFNLIFVNRYKIIFQVAQNEYIINTILTIINIITQLSSIFIIIKTKNIILVRLVYFLYSILGGIVIIIYARKKYTFISFNEHNDPSLIKGTKDVLVGKFTSVIYSSATVIFLSTFVGTLSTSIYSTYNSVVSVIRNCIYSFVNAPQNALGQLIASKNNKDLARIFNEYEYIVLMIECILLSITYVMIIPFIKLYTSDIADINYINYFLPLLIILNVFIEIIHIPSGIIILMSGDFKVSKNIQLITCILLLIFDFIGGIINGLFGILIATILVNTLLACLEIIYVRKYKLKTDFWRYVIKYFPIILFTVIITFLESKIIWFIPVSIVSFIYYGILITVINFMFLVIFSFMINRRDTISIIKRIFRLLRIKIN